GSDSEGVYRCFLNSVPGNGKLAGMVLNTQSIEITTALAISEIIKITIRTHAAGNGRELGESTSGYIVISFDETS
ncbi:MAG: hypothetical protein ACREMY_28225, partial [bacterium]